MTHWQYLLLARDYFKRPSLSHDAVHELLWYVGKIPVLVRTNNYHIHIL
uniref:Uncharacterized protein n=1 Tax=Rhizophora mucronata TaxID=61149 RepID=A0A2P2Q6A7_RHIMU